MRRRGAYWLGPLVLAAAAVLASRPAGPQAYVAGRTYFDGNACVEFRGGELPIVLSAPHGGTLDRAGIPDRRSGTMVPDVGTEDLAREVAAALRARTRREPSLVICRLKRVKVDVNRETGEGAQGNPIARRVWIEYHQFLEAARAMAVARYGRALVVDLHGHSHAKPRIEIGYLLDAAAMNRSDAELDEPAWANRSSIRSLAAESGIRFSALLRGPSSLGGLLASAGYPSVPSPTTPGPGDDPFYEGGYITRRHGSVDGGFSSAVQIETPYRGLRDSPGARARFAEALADALLTCVGTWWRIEF